MLSHSAVPARRQHELWLWHTERGDLLGAVNSGQAERRYKGLRERLQIGNERLQIGNERLQIGNERLQIGNERLQIGNESHMTDEHMKSHSVSVLFPPMTCRARLADLCLCLLFWRHLCEVEQADGAPAAAAQ